MELPEEFINHKVMAGGISETVSKETAEKAPQGFEIKKKIQITLYATRFFSTRHIYPTR